MLQRRVEEGIHRIGVQSTLLKSRHDVLTSRARELLRRLQSRLKAHRSNWHRVLKRLKVVGKSLNRERRVPTMRQGEVAGEEYVRLIWI